MNIFFSICLIFIPYWILIFLINITFVETEGQIIENSFSTYIYEQPASFSNIMERRPTIRQIGKEFKFRYKYNVSGITYESSRLCNVFFFPDILKSKAKHITVYYNHFINEYSVLFKCDLKYLFINSIPMLILFMKTLKPINQHIDNNSNFDAETNEIVKNLVNIALESRFGNHKEHELEKYFTNECLQELSPWFFCRA